MISDEEKLKSIKSNIDQYSRRSLNLAAFNSQDELVFHQYIQNICQRLLGDTVDLSSYPMMFALSDEPEENAAFVHKEGEYQIIYITEKLFKLCQNEDQLAFILGHELGHFEEYKRQNEHNNTKAEETAADLRAVQKMARAGYNLEEAHKIAAKLFNSGYVSIESLKDPHTNDKTRLNSIDAMIIATKQRVIEDTENQVEQVTPISDYIKEIVNKRPTPMLFSQRLRADIEKAPDAEVATKIWLDAFDEAACDYNGKLIMTENDIYALAYAVNSICKKYPDRADTFWSLVMTDMESWKRGIIEDFHKRKELMSEVLYNVRTNDFSTTYINADNENSKAAKILQHYLKGFREATGDEFDTMIQKFEYIESLVAKPSFNNYVGILVKNFNLLELEFNENDIGKHFSPEILKFIRLNLNGKDKFETMSGLTINPLGEYMVIKNEKLSVCTIVNRDGNVEFSVPLEKIDDMYKHLIARTITEAYKDVIDIKNNNNLSEAEKFARLKSAYKVLTPQATLNDLDNILKIRAKKDDESILLTDVEDLLDEDVKSFFAERSMRPYSYENAPYMQFVTENMAEYIKNAPKEEFNDIFDYLTAGKHNIHSNCEEKLWIAFFENKDFFATLQQQINATSLQPTSVNEWNFMHLDESTLRLTTAITHLTHITDKKLVEHIAKGKDLNSFEAPFTKYIGELCGFSTGKFSKQELEDSLNQTRNTDRYYSSLLQDAYMLYYSYDALKDDDQSDLNKTFGTNCAGFRISNIKNIILNYLEDDLKYKIDEKEAEHLKQYLDVVDKSFDTVYQKLTEKINNEENWSTLDGNILFYCVLYNSNSFGFYTIVQNKEFLDLCLKLYPNDKDRFSCIHTLSYIANQNESTVENDAIKKQIFPVIKSVFDRDDLSLLGKTKTFCELSERNLFQSDNVDYYNLLIGTDGKSGLLKQIQEQHFSTQETCYKLLLGKDNRIPDPEIRAEIIKKLAIAWHNNHSPYNSLYNDITATDSARQNIIQDVQDIKNSNISSSDKVELLKQLSELMMSQKELSLAMKPDNINVETSDKNAIMGAYGVDALSYLMHNHPELREKMQDFLLGYGMPEEAKKLEHELKLAICKEADERLKSNLCERLEKGDDVGKDLPTYPADLRKYYYKINTENLKSFKKEFDAASLEVKAVIVNEVLTTGKYDWISTFNVTSKKLFEGAGDLAQMGSDFLYSYIDARPESEKTFYLAAMMAAANNKSKSSSAQFIDSPYTPEQRNLARGLRMFLENSGPAGTKLAQAMASYSDVPDFIRFEMQFAKSQANPPARWDIFSGQDDVTSELLKYGHLGKRLGSASFFVTYELGDKIVKILRRGAKIKADNEFAIYKEMLTTLKNKYPNISSFKRLVDNAAGNVDIETNLDIGYEQLLDAKKLYPEKVKSDKVEFKLEVMDWSAKGKDWAILEKAQGVDFKDLEGSYKTAVAKAIFSTELANMLSGKRFDSDRHGGQYKIDPSTNTIGIFDTGSISTVEPTQKEQQVLGIVLARTIKNLAKNPNIATVFSQEIDKATNEFYKREITLNKPIPPYLSEFQRGLLALNDFYRDLKPKDLIECVIKSVDTGHHKINDNIVNGLKNEMVKSIKNKETFISDVLTSEKPDKLSPQARANRRIGMILFEAIYQNAQDGGNLKLSDAVKEKILPKLNSFDNSLQIFKGVVRGAFAKINPQNYSTEDKVQLGALLYQVCAQDALNKKLKKDVSIQEVFEQIERKNPNQGEFSRNISTILKTISTISSVDSEKIKRAAIFVAFADKYVAKGYRKAAMQDKSVGLGKRLIHQLEPMGFIPPKAKKLLIKNFGKKMIINHLNRQIFGIKAKNGMQRT